MAQKSEIEWTDATWNPVTGCTKIGPGCDNCYAERFAERWRGIEGHPYEQGFDLRLWPARLGQPARWKKPRMIFVNSMSDLFHKDIPKSHIDAVFDAMETADWHVYQVLTKRSSLMRNYVKRRYDGGRVPSHIWLGVSVEDSAHKSRIEHLRQINSDAATELRIACESFDVAFFFKQWGGARPKSGGRLLEGAEWNGFPWQIVPDAIMAELTS